MSTPEPKFSVGEVVMVRCEVAPEYNSDSSLIIEAEYDDGTQNVDVISGENYESFGWTYWFDGCSAWLLEQDIRKRPPPADKEFSADLQRMLGGVVKRGEKA